jgi:hypothetical protein
MLTVFKANEKAMDFYCQRLNYEFDEDSPSVCGDDTAQYEILSKPV